MKSGTVDAALHGSKLSVVPPLSSADDKLYHVHRQQGVDGLTSCCFDHLQVQALLHSLQQLWFLQVRLQLPA